jgi:glycosidase
MARSNHRYDTENYLHVDPSLGGDAAFAALAAAAQAKGIRIILDGVFNHASSDSVYFDRYHRYPTDGACESTSSPWRSWFKISGSTPCTSSDYEGWSGNDTLPVFQHDNAAVKDFFFRGPDAVAKHWLALGASGWRLDAAQEIDHSWWREFRTAVKAAAPDAPLIAEDTAGPADATPYLLGNEFDGVMNYRFRADAAGFVRTTSDQGITALTPSRLDHALAAMREEYPPQASADSFNLLDSHDTVRVLNLLVQPGDHGLVEARERQRLAALLQFTYVGAPMILYGDEVGINAPGADPFNRAPYPWADASGDLALYGPPDQGMLDYYSRLGQVRTQLPALKDGGFATVLTGNTTKASGDNDVYAFLRAGGAAKPVLIVLNKGPATESATLPVRGDYPNGTSLLDALGGPGGTVNGGAVTVSVPARSGLVLVGGS